MEFLIGTIIGMLITSIVVFFCMKIGTLKIYIPDRQDESPYLYVELNKPVSYICKKKCVLFVVDVSNIKTQK